MKIYIYISISVFIILATLLFFIPLGTKIPKDDRVLDLFRTVHLGKDRKVVLQSKISELADITDNLGNDYYSLKKGSFSNADSIAMEVNNNKQIIRILFFYNYAPEFSNDTAYLHEQRKYRKMISEGDEFNYTDDKRSLKATKWLNLTTIFELIEATTNNRREIYSVVFDAKLYKEKYEGLMSNSDSWEIFKRTALK